MPDQLAQPVSSTRQLAAIMFTDMVGYSRLAQEDEELSLALLEEHRKILRPIFTSHNGHEIETAGDSFFIEFKSAVEAAKCAIEIQSVLYERNKGAAVDRQIKIRIGIHIGDVVFMKDNIHGDGVNIAARLEPLAEPGGICLSEDVARQIRNKVEHPVVKIGKRKLKNISMPMDIYCIKLPWTWNDNKQRINRSKIFRYAASALGLLLITILIYLVKDNLYPGRQFSKYRLAVLPLTNISHDKNDEYFVDGLTEELISSLSQIGDLKIIARTSIMKYKNANKGVFEIGKELKVGTILEGSVRKVDNKARITVQLIDVSTQEHIWSRDFDREVSDIFQVQSEIAQNVANELKVRLVSSEKERLDRIYTKNAQAFQEYLIGKHLLNSKTSEGIQSAILHFHNSVDLDPDFSLAYTNLAYGYTLLGVAGFGTIPRQEAEKKANEYIERALLIDENLAEAHAALGYIKFRIDWDWENAEKEFRHAIALKPGYAIAHEWYALFLSLHTRFDEAIYEIEKALELDPLSPGATTGLARIYYFKDDFENAIDQCKKALELDPTYAEAYFALGMTYNATGQNEQSISNFKKAIEFSNARPVIVGFLGYLYVKVGEIEKAKELLKELEAPPVNNDKRYASCFIKYGLGQKEETFEILEKLLDERYGILVYMKVEDNVFDMSDDPRYLTMLQKMGFELD